MNIPLRLAVAIAFGVASTGAQAITITSSQDANSLANTLLGGANTGILVTGSTLSGHTAAVTLSGSPLR